MPYFFFPFTTFLYVCDFIYSQHLARIFQSRLNIFFLSCPFSQLLLGISTLGECWFLKPHIQRTEWSPWHWLSNFYSYHAFFKHLTIIFGSSITNPGHAGSHRLLPSWSPWYLILIYCSLYPCLTSYRTSLPLTGAGSQASVMEYKENGLTFHLGILASQTFQYLAPNTFHVLSPALQLILYRPAEVGSSFSLNVGFPVAIRQLRFCFLGVFFYIKWACQTPPLIAIYWPTKVHFRYIFVNSFLNGCLSWNPINTVSSPIQLLFSHTNESTLWKNFLWSSRPG